MARHSSKPKSEYTIQTVANAFRMLEVFQTETEMGVSDLARQLGLHKNNAFRLLATLEQCGYVDQDPSTELYSLAPRCLELGQSFARAQSLAKLARPVLNDLSERLGETAHLGSLARSEAGPEVVHLDAALPDQLVLTGSRVGSRLPASCTAIGKMLIAGELARAPKAMEQMVAETTLSERTPATIVDPSKLLEDIRTSGLRGYAVDRQEYAEGLSCVAAPILDGEGRMVAALSLSGPSARLSDDALHGDARDVLVERAASLSRALGAGLSASAHP